MDRWEIHGNPQVLILEEVRPSPVPLWHEEDQVPWMTSTLLGLMTMMGSAGHPGS